MNEQVSMKVSKNEWINEWVNINGMRICQWVSDKRQIRVNEWMSTWVHKWVRMNEWMNEWIKMQWEWVHEWVRKGEKEWLNDCATEYKSK